MPFRLSLQACIGAFLVFGTVVPSAVAAQRVAAVTGLAAAHDLRSERGRLCFSDHYHYGSSSGISNRKKAEYEAVVSWSSFVDFEYGNTWANFSKASAKDMNCTQSASGWSCDLSARPCR